MANNFLETKTITLAELLGNGKKYIVPPYQRDYSWDEEKWEDLFFDLNELEKSVHPHYMGAIVLQSSNGKEYSIIDGQQRIATLSIFIIAIIQILRDMAHNGIDTEQNNERIDIFCRQYLGDKNPASLMRTSKLELNNVNNHFFSRYIVQFEKPAKPLLIKEDSSNKMLYGAFEYFYKHLKEKLAGKSGEDIAVYLTDAIADKVKFIMIVVEDELNAYTLFETLNARGVELTATDLLKNYLFSLVGGNGADLKVLQLEWSAINNTVGTKEFPNFLRYYINSKSQLVRQNALYKEVKKSVSNYRDVFELVDSLKELASVYVALKNPADEIWSTYSEYKELKYRLSELKLFDVKQQIPLLLSAYKKLSESEFVKVVKICSIISFRYSAIGRLNPNEMERTYNKCAMKIANSEVTKAKNVFDELRKIYIGDDEFEKSFSTASINTGSGRQKSLVKYILINLENKLSGFSYDFETNDATIEHILPENPSNSEEWSEKFNFEEIEKLRFWLGNYTLLESSKNSNIGTNSFSEKLLEYKSSSYLLSNKISYCEWNPVNLKKRQEELAKIAKSIWRLDF